jgi:2-C-methyl-D-erythritol 4-phosphate cytidylyltransferase
MLKAKKDKFLGTDESMLVSRIGEKINIVEGASINFKITTKEDIEIAKKLLKFKS